MLDFIFICILSFSNGGSGNSITQIQTATAQDCNDVGYSWVSNLKTSAQKNYSSYTCVKIKKVK